MNTKKIANFRIVMENDQSYEKATLGAGCFWCIEAIFQRVKGVVSVAPGYSGGNVDNPTYEQVCTGQTGHAEVARITFDPSVVTFEELLEVFWHTHNPTTPNRQGADMGTQYRSVIFYHNEEQKGVAVKSKNETDRTGLWKDPIVTEIQPLKNFFKAEDYHHDYYNNNQNQPYCTFVIAPKVQILKKDFSYLWQEEF
ncbi:MAG TPA: peptide-methionine (S)-S-oxide reductase MsrA [Balneolales bacterium]|nr:peptide-methionine (S)-S-oxide reductase MsrA [Balneolales bacterium]